MLSEIHAHVRSGLVGDMRILNIDSICRDSRRNNMTDTRSIKREQLLIFE